MIRVHARDSFPRGACSDIYDRFEIFVGACERTFNVRLAHPYLRSVGDIKKFCSGLLEGQSNHPWRLDLQRDKASKRTRMSIAHSLFLFRKLIPSEEPQVAAYVERMCTPQEEPSPLFLDFVRGQVRKMFPVGWDRSYQDKCVTSTLPITSCYESGRRSGGCRGLDAQARMDREEFCSYVSESVAPRPRGVSRVQAVMADGKWRVISIPPRWDNSLRPFHQCLYDFVSKQSWCLRGEATPARFKDFVRKPNEIFVSGDYESATDNLNSEVQRTILCELIMRSRSIPRGIALHALSTFDSSLELDGNVSVQARGQLMGQLLSFPLLCLVNYLTFKFSVPRDVPVKINGDDIVFRATEREASRWRKNVGQSGLVLSAGKTLEDSRFYSLNSCMFEASANKVRFVPFIRPKAIWSLKERECERVASLASRFRSFLVGMGSRRRLEFESLFLEQNIDAILRCRRSLTRGMGMKVSEAALRSSGLWSRELFYLEQVEERPLPSLSFSQIKCNDCPPGWKKVSPHWYPREVIKGWEFRHSHETVKRAWTGQVLSDSYAEQNWMRLLDEGCSPWGLKYLGTFKRSMLRMSRRQFWRWRCVRTNRSLFGRVSFSKGVGVWMPGTDHLASCDKLAIRPENLSVEVPPPDDLLFGVRIVDGSLQGSLDDWVAGPQRRSGTT
jgi:hypothetical protein